MHKTPKFGVRNRKVSTAGTSPFEGVWHLMNLEVQSEPCLECRSCGLLLKWLFISVYSLCPLGIITLSLSSVLSCTVNR